MKLNEYFEKAKGIGVLATADSEGRVDVAVYARPHFIDEETVAFIMTDRLSHQNLQSNPHAAYLFVEAGEAYAGKRLYLTKTREETDSEQIKAIRRRSAGPGCRPSEGETRFLVCFRINKVRPLVGDTAT